MERSTRQGLLFDPGESKKQKASSSTFSNNLALPIHRWFRYSAGFSAVWIREVIAEQKKLGRQNILDPFVGSGTVLIEAERADTHSAGAEPHPFVHRVTRTKLLWRTDAADFRNAALETLKLAKSLPGDPTHYPPLIHKCYPEETLRSLGALHHAWIQLADGSPESELVWLTVASILRQCSPVGTANWQYVLPKKSKAKTVEPFTAFSSKMTQICEDMLDSRRFVESPPARLVADDARQLSSIESGWADLVITSPPYPNNFDYADATRLEMSFFGEIAGWGDLQQTVRKFLLRSCTQHVSPIVSETDEILKNSRLAPISAEIAAVCERLAAERDTHGGKKIYHTMIAAYFSDMAQVWHALRRTTRRGCRVCFVIGDSAPYGVYVPVEKWLGELALAAGFESYHFEKTRDRNIKWKNRKHRVPLHEGRLWVEG